MFIIHGDIKIYKYIYGCVVGTVCRVENTFKANKHYLESNFFQHHINSILAGGGGGVLIL